MPKEISIYQEMLTKEINIYFIKQEDLEREIGSYFGKVLSCDIGKKIVIKKHPVPNNKGEIVDYHKELYMENKEQLAKRLKLINQAK